MKKAWLILQRSGGRALLARLKGKALLEARRRAGALTARVRSEAQAILSLRPRPLVLAVPECPEVTIVLHAGLPARRLFHTLLSLADVAPFSPPFEVIVLEGDDTADSRLLAGCSGLTVAPQSAIALGAALNAAAALARSKSILFLGEGALERSTLTSLLRSRSPERVLSPQVRTAAGGVWDTGADPPPALPGASWPFNDARDPSVAYAREITFCRHSMLVDSQTFTAAGGFGPFETWTDCSADLCTRLRAHGCSVIYQPKAVVVADPPESATRQMRATDTTRGSRSVLVIDDYVPMFDRSAGGKRMFELLKLMKVLGNHVIFVPDEGGSHEPYTSLLQELGIEVRYKWKGRSPIDEVAAFAPDAAVVWISRPQLCAKYLPIVRTCCSTPVIYDTVDLHHRRLHAAEKVTGAKSTWEPLRDLELELARTVERTIVTTREEQIVLADHGITTTQVIPVVQPPSDGRHPPVDARSGLLFVGNYTHRPNVDAVMWFCREILPLVQERIPGITLTLAGAEENARVRALASDTVNVIGYQASLRELFDRHRVFVAPLRFGAGIKGKIIEALGNGLPVVSTHVGAEGISMRDGQDALIADHPAQFARAIDTLYNDAVLWKNLADNGFAVARGFSPEAVLPLLKRALEFGEGL